MQKLFAQAVANNLSYIFEGAQEAALQVAFTPVRAIQEVATLLLAHNLAWVWSSMNIKSATKGYSR
jgi:hypothetical protein